MPLTRSFRETVADRAKASPGFRAALVEEAMQALADGDVRHAVHISAAAASSRRVAQRHGFSRVGSSAS